MGKKRTLTEMLSKEVAESRNEYPTRSVELRIDRNLRGIGGWLLFFCISLTVLSPASFTYGLISGSQRSDSDENSWVELSVNGATTIYGIITGILLWTKRKGSVKQAKWFLIISALTVLLTTIYDLGTRKDQWLIPIIFVIKIAYFAMWMLYFSNSRRIANTFEAEGRKS
jgi:hypothetical protein